MMKSLDHSNLIIIYKVHMDEDVVEENPLVYVCERYVKSCRPCGRAICFGLKPFVLYSQRVECPGRIQRGFSSPRARRAARSCRTACRNPSHALA